MLDAALDGLAALLLIAAAFFALVGSWGLAKLGSFLKRIHAPTKASTLGLGLALIASMLWFGARGSASLHELLITLFLFITVPVASQMLAQAAFEEDRSARPPAPPAPSARAGEGEIEEL